LAGHLMRNVPAVAQLHPTVERDRNQQREERPPRTARGE
jgi:hypothetical protein